MISVYYLYYYSGFKFAVFLAVLTFGFREPLSLPLTAPDLFYHTAALLLSINKVFLS